MDKLKDNLTNDNTIYARSHGTLIDEQFTQVAVESSGNHLLVMHIFFLYKLDCFLLLILVINYCSL